MQIKSLLKKALIKTFIVLLVLSIVCCAVYYFIQTHFLWGTTIDGVDCSLMSIPKAVFEINSAKKNDVITFTFSNGKSYEIVSSQINLQVDQNKIKQIFDEQHLYPDSPREYSLDGFLLVDENLLLDFFKQFPELQKDQMIERQDAYIVWDENQFYIEEQVFGTVIDFDEATLFALEKIKNGEKEINFTSITEIMPDIFVSDLTAECNNLNAILNTSISLELSNGELFVLDSNIIKNWVYQDEHGKFGFDTESGIISFVDELALKVDEVNVNMHFRATGLDGYASVNIPKAVRAKLDKEAQIQQLTELMGNAEPIIIRPKYDKDLISDLLISYIEIDLSRQHIWFYKDGVLIVDTPCVTGKTSQGYGTPTGVFFLLNKDRKVYLEGFNKDGSPYKAFVEYWMRFNQGIGMHDASWRYEFGGDIYIYSGSHGCVNMPPEAAAITFENIDNTMPIIVYNSET